MDIPPVKPGRRVHFQLPEDSGDKNAFDDIEEETNQGDHSDENSLSEEVASLSDWKKWAADDSDVIGDDPSSVHLSEVPLQRPPVATRGTKRVLVPQNEDITFPYYSDDPMVWRVKPRPPRKAKFHPHRTPRSKPKEVSPYQAPVLTYLWLMQNPLEIMLRETNKYGLLRSEQELVQLPWKDLTVPELLVYQGLSLLMGSCVKNNMEHYFTEKGVNATPGYAALMTLRRFKQIHSHLHYEDNDVADYREWSNKESPGHDVLFKIRAFIESANERFITGWAPERNLSIDERVSAFHFRHRVNRVKKIPPSLSVLCYSFLTDGEVLRKISLQCGCANETNPPWNTSLWAV